MRSGSLTSRSLVQKQVDSESKFFPEKLLLYMDSPHGPRGRPGGLFLAPSILTDPSPLCLPTQFAHRVSMSKNPGMLHTQIIW